MLDHSDWHGLHITTHSLRIGGVTVRLHNEEDHLEIRWLGRWSDDNIFKYLRTDLLASPEELQKTPSYRRKRKTVLHYFCSCEVDATEPGGDARMPRYTALRDINDTSRLSDRHKILTCEWRRHQRRKAAKQHAFITPALCSTHAFVKSNLQAIPYVSPHVIDWNHITNHYQGDKLWFLAVWMAKCRWRRWDKEIRSPRANKHHPTYLLATHEPLQILVNTKLVTPHDVQKAKTLLTSYREFTKSITPEQQIIWDAVEPKKGKKHAYIPNSVWASKEQMERQQRYITYGDASEPEEAFKNIQYKYPKGDTRPKAARGMPAAHLPSGTCGQGTASLRIRPFQQITSHPETKPAPPLQTTRGNSTKL